MDCYTSHGDVVKQTETIILDGFADILGTTLTTAQLSQAGLPLSAGGCGLRCPSVQKPAARLASLSSFYTRGVREIGLPEYCCQVSPKWATNLIQDALERLGPNFDPLTTWRGQVSELARAEHEHTQQKWWSDRIAKQTVMSLLDTVSPRDQARLLEQGNSVTGSFMTVAPSTSLRSTIPSSLYRLGMRWWLGCPPH